MLAPAAASACRYHGGEHRPTKRRQTHIYFSAWKRCASTTIPGSRSCFTPGRLSAFPIRRPASVGDMNWQHQTSQIPMVLMAVRRTASRAAGEAGRTTAPTARPGSGCGFGHRHHLDSKYPSNQCCIIVTTVARLMA